MNEQNKPKSLQDLLAMKNAAAVRKSSPKGGKPDKTDDAQGLDSLLRRHLNPGQLKFR